LILAERFRQELGATAAQIRWLADTNHPRSVLNPRGTIRALQTFIKEFLQPRMDGYEIPSLFWLRLCCSRALGNPWSPGLLRVPLWPLW